MSSLVVNYIKENKTDIWHACWQNYLYGFTGWMIPVAVTIGNAYLIPIVACLFYSFLSKIINREKYNTNLGKYFFFPVPATFGALSAFYLGEYLKLFL